MNDIPASVPGRRRGRQGLGPKTSEQTVARRIYSAFDKMTNDFAAKDAEITRLATALRYGFDLYGYDAPDGYWPIEMRHEFDRLARAALGLPPRHDADIARLDEEDRAALSPTKPEEAP